MRVSSETAVSMPMKNLIAIIGAVAVGVWAYFGVIERLNKLETGGTLLEKDLQQVTKTRILSWRSHKVKNKMPMCCPP